MKTAKEIIEETANHYTSANRSASPAGSCFYKREEDMCAVGRCMTDFGIKAFGDYMGTVEELIDEAAKEPFDYYLKEEYRGHSEEFWRSLQRMHDNAEYWNEEGMSSEGEQYKDRLIYFYTPIQLP